MWWGILLLADQNSDGAFPLVMMSLFVFWIIVLAGNSGNRR